MDKELHFLPKYLMPCGCDNRYGCLVWVARKQRAVFECRACGAIYTEYDVEKSRWYRNRVELKKSDIIWWRVSVNFPEQVRGLGQLAESLSH